MAPDVTRNARDILTFYLEAGVDEPLGEVAINRLAAAEDAQPEPPRVETSAARDGASDAGPRGAAPVIHAAVPPSPDTAAMAAREAARTAANLADLRAIMEAFEGCGLKATATRLVFADGNPQARVMFVGEAPGSDEDREGLPFVGRSGKLLDRMMEAIGLDRSSAYISNIIPWRPPGNRDPSPQESTICLPFIQRHIALADPDILVCLGRQSAATLLGIKDGILRTRGRWFDYDTGCRTIRAMVTLHPAYLLRQPVQKRLAWRDFLAVKAALG